MNDVVIRSARPSEIRRVAELRWQWVRERGGSPPVAEHDEYVDFFVEWAERNPAHHCTVVVRSGIVIGMAWLVTLARVPSPRGLERAGFAHRLLNLVRERPDGPKQVGQPSAS
ncbi:MAG: acetyltransferase [Frondihabitans sp.]|nr:acetyltransferase [Frondihabitans sp.]